VFGIISTIVRQEYTAAVIISGETAKKKNGLAGEFIVRIAGLNVESLISGRGSGAVQYSQAHYYATVTNVDIGGGSANRGRTRCHAEHRPPNPAVHRPQFPG